MDAKKPNDKSHLLFRSSIIAFVHEAETNPKPSQFFTIAQICSSFKLPRRRIYDVLNVLEAVGCMRKCNSETIEWLGLLHIVPEFRRLQEVHCANSADVPISRIVPTEICVSMGQLTASLILCFLALQVRTLGIKQVSYFVSRNNNRFKTTLCKMYQIVHILEAIGVIKREESRQGEITLEDSFYCVSPIQLRGKSKDEPLSLETLLNRPVSDLDRILKQRRLDFTMCAKQSQFRSS